MDQDLQNSTLTAFQRCLILECDILYLTKHGLTSTNSPWKNFCMNAIDTTIESNSFSNGLFERNMRWKTELLFLSIQKKFQIYICIINKKLFLKRDERSSLKEFSRRKKIWSQAKILTSLLMILLKEFLTLIMTIQASYLNLL